MRAIEDARTPRPDVVAKAKERMMDIARRASQTATKKQDFLRRIEEAKKKRRGGASGDVSSLGKRKGLDDDAPRSMLRKAAPQEGPRARQRIYGPKTEVFDMDAPIRAY